MAGAERIIARGRGHRELTLRYCSEALESLPAKRYGQRLMCLSTLSNLAIADGDLWRARGLNRESSSWHSGSAIHYSKHWRTTTGRGFCNHGARFCVRWMKCIRAWNACAVCRRNDCTPCAHG